MKHTHLLFFFLLLPFTSLAQGWPKDYDGVMLQGFYWDSYKETTWGQIEAQADELSRSFDLIWIPQSGYCNTSGNMMGYTPVYYFNQNSSFGCEAQLRSMIRTLKERGTGVIADVVVNHRNNMGSGGSWVDYPKEEYNGETYQMLSTDVCRNDDGGNTKSWADKNGISLSANDDTGEDWSGCRDLDHKSENVRRCIKAYLSFLLNDMGFTGFRYDMVKGFSASYVGEYNYASKPQFSVGEHWSSSWEISEWIKATRPSSKDEPASAAFDFQFRWRMRDAINNNDWRHLGYDDKPLAWQSDYRRWAVTFVENHDTERRSNDEQYPIVRDTLAANAYLLAMPGTPCVFWRHWVDCKEYLKPMIEARRLAGVCNTSSCEQLTSNNNYYAIRSKGQRGYLLCVVGKTPEAYRASTGQYTPILEGKGYRYYLAKAANTVWADVPSGRYEEPINVTLTAVSTSSSAVVVYTTDGSEPTAESAQVASGKSVTIDSDCTLKMGVLINGAVKGIVSRQYEIQPLKARKVTIYVRLPSSWTNLYLFAWNGSKELNGSWPGSQVTSRKRIDENTWYYKTLNLTKDMQSFSMVLNTASGARQTVDLTGITGDRYFVVTTAAFGSKFVVDDVTVDMTSGIDTPQAVPFRPTDTRYDLQGRPVTQPRRGQIYIQGGKRILER